VEGRNLTFTGFFFKEQIKADSTRASKQIIETIEGRNLIFTGFFFKEQIKADNTSSEGKLRIIVNSIRMSLK
jgi:hypothetical protein